MNILSLVGQGAGGRGQGAGGRGQGAGGTGQGARGTGHGAGGRGRRNRFDAVKLDNLFFGVL